MQKFEFGIKILPGLIFLDLAFPFIQIWQKCNKMLKGKSAMIAKPKWNLVEQ